MYKQSSKIHKKMFISKLSSTFINPIYCMANMPFVIGMCVCREGSEGVEGVQLSDVNGNRPRKYCNIYNVYSGCLVTMYLLVTY